MGTCPHPVRKNAPTYVMNTNTKDTQDPRKGVLYTHDNHNHYQLVPAQDVPYALILWYVSKIIYLS